MDIDLATLRGLEKERDISFDVLIDAIEQALLSAYHKTPGAHRQARAVIDQTTGKVRILAARRPGARVGHRARVPA